MLAKIYLKQITNWSSPSIKSLNPGEHLPNLAIRPIFRSDGSGDTYAFTQYLSSVSGAWKGRAGFGTAVGFPTGVGQKGNSGVTSTFTYAIVPRGSSKSGLLKQFIKYALTTGQHFGAALDFTPTPQIVLNAGKRAANSL